MYRCLQLAALGAGHVSPNPMVGALLEINNEIIGEGYHQKYGEAHAEVNCLHSVQNDKIHLIPFSTLYVSLEPCTHFGKTPPCTDLIINNHIPRVVISCVDPFREVNGKGIERLIDASIEVKTGVLEKEGRDLNKRFFIFQQSHRPYIVLKWAETADKKIGTTDHSRLFITNEYTNRLVHKWRSEEAAIMAGTNTVLFDDPQLTNRLWNGSTPVRIIVDMDLRLPSFLRIYDDQARTIVFNSVKHEEKANQLFYQVNTDTSLVHQVVHGLYQLNIQSVLVEGGAMLLQSFIDEGLWDEARIITNQTLSLNNGLPSPILRNEKWESARKLGSDIIQYYSNQLIN